MKCFSIFLVLAAILCMVFAQLPIQQMSIPPVVTYGSGDGTTSCPSQEQRDSTHQALNNAVANALALEPAHRCGAGQWTRVAYLNMNDTTQVCPSVWQDRSTNGVRVCGRHTSSGCYGTFYPTGCTYSKVCGRVIGFQIGHTDGFHTSTSINGAYVEGVSITHGSPRSHIWTLAADLSETGAGCPCEGGTSPPLFVGNNYYCESGNNATGFTSDFLYANDPLWDGQQCQSEGTCCSTAPWFTVDLVIPTTDSIEVRICADSTPTEDTPINLLELYVQ